MKSRILVVDDEAPIRKMLGRLLESVGYACTLASDGATAWAALEQEPFDLILTDVSMPGSSGLDLAAKAKDHYPDTAVLMVTGLDDPGLAARAVELGSFGYILKPFERNEVVIAVLNALRRQKLEVESRAVQRVLEAEVQQRTAELERQARALHRRNRQLGLIGKINREVSGHLLLADLLPTLAREIRPLARFDSIIILGLPVPETVEVLYAWPEGAARVGDRVTVRGSPVAAAIRSQRRSSLDATALNRPDGMPLCEWSSGLETAIFLPLSAGPMGRAVLCLGSQKKRKVPAETLDLLEMVAAQVAVALANSLTVRSLENLARLKSDFVAIASHELRTPLTMIKGYAKLLLTPGFSESEEERHRYLERLYAGSDRLSKLVDDLMQAARLEGGQSGLRQDTVRLRSVLRQLSPLLADRYGAEVHLPKGDQRVQADAIAVERVLFNLLDNAFKYGEGGGPPEVRWRKASHPTFLGVEVINRGTPFTPEERTRLFTRFGRLDRHTGSQGSGFGLYAARILVQQMGGEIGIDCHSDQVLFWFELPAGK